MYSDNSSRQTTPETPGSTGRHRILWIFSWALVFVFFGVALAALTNQAVMWSSSDRFCGTTCHSMTWAAAAYHRSTHYINNVGVRASCGDCHIPYDSGHATAVHYVKLLLFKADRGARDFWYESRKSIATKEEWEKRRPELSAYFEHYLTQHNYVTCRGCHSLLSFGGPDSHMKLVIHQGMLKADSYSCLECHVNIGHVYEQPSSKLNGWYSLEQAAAGEKLFEDSCSGCHGAKLQGGMGPALTGVTWKQRFGGAKLLTVWGEIKGPMAEYAGKTFTTQQALDILAYLLQQNGLAAGTRPLADTRELSDTLP
ncbi:MAG: NapC/NirT family cytochrome c [Candidatus Acidiferrum sp.]